MTFGEKFKAERAKRKLTQQEGADALGINRRMITPVSYTHLGSWDSHPSEDRSEPPFQRKDGSIIIPGICIVASSRHHMICTANPTVIALRRSLTPLREVLASEAVLPVSYTHLT